MATALYNKQNNPLTTDDEYTHDLSMAMCYQLVQSILKVDSALTEKVRWGIYLLQTSSDLSLG